LVNLNPNTIALKHVGVGDGLVKEKFGNPNLRCVYLQILSVPLNGTISKLIYENKLL